MRQLYLFIFAGLSLLSSPAKPVAPQRQEILVAAAADLKFAMDSLVKIFSAGSGDVTVKLVYGSSGNFFEQISNDAPFDLFFSADLNIPRNWSSSTRPSQP